MTAQDAFLVDAVRTPIGRVGGALAAIRPDDLLATVVRAVVDRVPELDPGSIDEVFAGDANGAGEDNRNVARMAVLLAGLPTTVPAATVNRLCGSGMEAIFAASRAVAVGDADVVIGCGVESMTRAPWVVAKPAKAFPTWHEQMWNSALGWRMVNPAMPVEWTISLGEGAEALADKCAIGRYEQDEFALRSHARAAAAWEAGWFTDEVVAVPGVDLTRDECIRPESSVQSLSRLKPVFRADGTVTAGNSSPMNDGAAATLVMSELRQLPELDPALVNMQGGAIAIGHPLGCFGARIVTTLAHHLRRTGGRYGLAAMCIGVGQGVAMVIENQT